MDLQHFSSAVNKVQFKKQLDDHTEKLKEQLPTKSWGIARKVLNIFLFQTTHDVLLNKIRPLNNVIAYLELPLDNANAKKLQKLARKESIRLDWSNIYSLEPEDSNRFQKYAKQIASCVYKCERCYLDLYWWRSRTTGSFHNCI